MIQNKFSLTLPAASLVGIFLCCSGALASTITLPASPATPFNTAADTVDPEHVMAAFHDAVASHDGARLGALFLPEGSTWVNVLSDQALARVRLKKPDTVKVRLSNFKDFANFVSTTKQSLDPRHTHLVLHSDGTIASAYFDYSFYIDGKEENRGSETWQLVKGETGWRIAAVSYSSNPNTQP